MVWHHITLFLWWSDSCPFVCYLFYLSIKVKTQQFSWFVYVCESKHANYKWNLLRFQHWKQSQNRPLSYDFRSDKRYISRKLWVTIVGRHIGEISAQKYFRKIAIAHENNTCSRSEPDVYVLYSPHNALRFIFLPKFREIRQNWPESKVTLWRAETGSMVVKRLTVDYNNFISFTVRLTQHTLVFCSLVVSGIWDEEVGRETEWTPFFNLPMLALLSSQRAAWLFFFRSSPFDQSSLTRGEAFCNKKRKSKCIHVHIFETFALDEVVSFSFNIRLLGSLKDHYSLLKMNLSLLVSVSLRKPNFTFFFNPFSSHTYLGTRSRCLTYW